MDMRQFCKEIVRSALQKLACAHEWDTIAHITIDDEFTHAPVGHRLTLVCRKCGKIRRVTL